MTNKAKQSAQGYRVPEIKIKKMLRSIATLGFKRQDDVQEEAKTYEYVFEESGIRITQLNLAGKRKEVAFKKVFSAAEKEKILAKGKFKEGSYIYYLDKETIR